MADQDVLGRKVFFLYPPAVLDEVLSVLSRNENEVYVTRDHEKLARYLKKDPKALLFANIDDGLKPAEWEKYVGDLMKDSKELRVGIISYNQNPALAQHYLADVGVQCGCITVKTGIKETTRILLATLDANEAKGRRKFLRATPTGTGSAELNVRMDGGDLVHGKVADISIVGISCILDGGPELNVGKKLSDIQCLIKGFRFLVSGVVVAKRTMPEGSLRYVVMFEPSSLDEVKKGKIHEAIAKLLQSEMEKKLNES
jgi:hypothetical protein